MLNDQKQELIYMVKQAFSDSLMQYKFARILLDCKKDVILDILSKRIYQLPNLFQPSLQNIVKRFPNTQIALVEINQQMTFEIYFQKMITNEQQLQNLIQTEFINKLYIQKIGIDKTVLLQSLGINEKKFEENYQVIFCEVWFNNMLQNCILGLQEMTDEILKIEKQIIQVEVFQCTKLLVFQRLRNYIIQNKIQFQKAQIEFCKNQEIIISANQNELQIVIEKMKQFKNLCENQLIEQTVNLSQKEIKFIQKNFKEKITELEQSHELVILFNVYNEPFENLIQPTFQFDCEDKSLQLVTVNITRIQCDALTINFDNCKYNHNKYYSDILDLCGTQYTIFCDNMFDQASQLFTEGTALTFVLQKQKHVSYIINVNTAYLNQNNYEESIIKYLKKTIDSIFQQANSYQLKSIAIPFFIQKRNTQNYQLLMRVYFKRILRNLLMKSYSIEKVYISEEDYTQIDEGQQILNDLVQTRSIQYQWQWHDGKGFIDYEDDINQQIDEAYKQYLKTQQQLKILLHFQESKKPGTHKVDLNKNIIKNISQKTQHKITFNLVNNIKIFSINNQQVSDSLNKYFILQEENNIKKFTIFLKQYQVVFDTKEIIQINLETQYVRLIQFIPYNKNQVISKPSAKSLLENKSFKIQKSENFKQQRKENQYQLIIQSFNAELNKLAENTLLDLLNKEILNYNLAIPDLNQNLISDLEQFLQNKSILFEGQITSNQNVNIKIFQNKQQRIASKIQNLVSKQTEVSYPANWVKQQKNFEKIQLKEDEQEFQLITALFKQHDSGTIFKISRIQNKSLWNNYILEKKKLLHLYEQQGKQLTEVEQSRYLWHGVKGQHPKIIYEGQKDAFDYAYSNVGMWGPGIYFAEKSSYSRYYSYTLSQYDDAQYAGKLVFLCCLLTTGKVEVRNSNQSIKKPSFGYDCISGYTNGSNVFVLYSMDIRRAYPAYEVIFL